MSTLADTHITPKARPSIHHTILEWFSTQTRGHVLDAPAGYGHLSLKLKDMGYEVSCGEINTDICTIPDMPCVYTDLNRKIDAPTASFDYVCCVDGLEHMTDPYTAVKEFARVLKPGGIGVFSIPNYANIEKRLKFLVHGYLTKPTQYDAYAQANGTLFDFHNSPLTITQLAFMFQINQLDIIDIKRNAWKWKQLLLLPLVYALKGLNRLNSAKSKQKHRTDLTLDNRVILGGNNLIFITRKSTAYTHE